MGRESEMKQGIIIISGVRRGGVHVNKVRHVEDDHCCDIPCVMIKLWPNR